jgi:hypothetical protein
MKSEDLTGQTFGKLTAIAIHSGGKTKWFCKCTCGKITIVHASQLKSKHSTSCGGSNCKQHSRNKLSNTPAYRSWKAMLYRCYNIKSKPYKYYGGRGIIVCERWHNFDNFLNDMGQRPYWFSIDRIDNDGNYEPKNCRWVTLQDNNQHTSRTRWVIINGQKMSLKNAAIHANLKYDTLFSRLKTGWDFDVAIATPTITTRTRNEKSGTYDNCYRKIKEKIIPAESFQ